MCKEVVTHVRWSQAEIDEIDRIAKQRGVSRSEVIRSFYQVNKLLWDPELTLAQVLEHLIREKL